MSQLFLRALCVLFFCFFTPYSLNVVNVNVLLCVLPFGNYEFSGGIMDNIDV